MSAAAQEMSGRCLCGACQFELRGPANWIGHCHCESCRRATASAYTTWIGQANGHWTLLGATPKTYSSSAGVTRGFCPICGSPLFYMSEAYPEEVHFYAALLDVPEQVKPTANYHMDERLSWAPPGSITRC